MGIVDELKENIDIIDFISRYVRLRKSGYNYFGLCPFHSEKTPSFSVNPEKRIFHCFGCGESGDVISFYMKIENIDFKEAIYELAKEYNINIKEQNKRKNPLLEIHKIANEHFKMELLKNKDALEYLQKRKIYNDTIQNFEIGYASNSDNLIKKLQSQFEKENILNSGIFIEGKYGLYNRFENRIIFPIKNISGEIVAFGGRVIRNNKGLPKYINSSETSIFSKHKILYGFYDAIQCLKEVGYIVVTEGYFDCIRLHINGFKNTVATLGTALSRHHMNLISRYTKLMYLNFDSDSAGFNAMKRLAPIVFDSSLDVFVVTLDPKEDPDSFVLRYSRDMYRKKIEESKEYFEYIIDFLKTSYDMEKPFEKTKVINEISQLVSNIKDPLIKVAYIAKISKKFNISEDVIITRKTYNTINFYSTNRINKNRAVLSLLIKDIELFLWIENPDSIKAFFNSIELSLYEKLLDFYKTGESLDKLEAKLEGDIKRLYFDLLVGDFVNSLDEKSKRRYAIVFLLNEFEKEKLMIELKNIQKALKITPSEDLIKKYNEVILKLRDFL